MTEAEVPTVYESGQGYVISTWRNALLMMWTGAITSHALDGTERAGKMLERHYPPGTQVAVSVTVPGVPIPDDEVRKHAARLLRERSEQVCISVTVLEGDGFWISAGRMVMTALVGLAGGKGRTNIVKNVEEAALLVQPHVLPKTSLGTVENALKAFRG